ncbi:hypothetical protein K474DRAFT_707186 [Panus rudis PR-1116 ss-1]|nr:hypothetical protein K474DRAFT_707186 [Panus rudis PR-1116 ss-1]
MLIVALTQGFYVYRIWTLSKGRLCTSVISILLFARIVLGLASASQAYSSKTWATYRDASGPVITITTGLSLSAFVDLLITGSLIHFLRHARTGHESTDGIIHWLVVHAAHNGAVNMLVSLATLLAYVINRESILYVGLCTLASKLYVNSLLGSLNARHLCRSRMYNGRIESMYGWRDLPEVIRKSPTPPIVPVTIHVTRESITHKSEIGRDTAVYTRSNLLEDPMLNPPP